MKHHFPVVIQHCFNRILIANRGEIACRIIRTARRLGIQTVAIYSRQEPFALHKDMADQAFLLPHPDPQQAYLDQDAILALAKEVGADGIHPGYGFLSENASFAEKVKAAGLVFIGPSPEAIRIMGLKSDAKVLMMQKGVPVLQGFIPDKDLTPLEWQKQAEVVGYPLLIKAANGGGGKGMRCVQSADEFLSAWQAVQNEAVKAFGHSVFILEPYLENPRHIEVQIAFDKQGQGVALFERDCSWQRRYQKVIEETPAPGLSEDKRMQMCEAALKVARSVGYHNLGTVEFLLDQQGHFYFIEMNTRLQVEHAITEEMLGLDLVAWQFHLASGFGLPLEQDAVNAIKRRTAVEARIYAEDPFQDFLPSSGPLVSVKFPSDDDGIRIETGIRTGDEVSVYYDPLIAKFIGVGDSREEAFLNLSRAIQQTKIVGPQTNLPFLLHCIDKVLHQNLIPHTTWIQEHPFLSPVTEDVWMALIVKHFLKKSQSDPPDNNLWHASSFLTSSVSQNAVLCFTCDKNIFEVQIRMSRSGLLEYKNKNDWFVFKKTADFKPIAETGFPNRFYFYFQHQTKKVEYFPFGIYRKAEKSHSDNVLAPMTGIVLEILKSEGQFFQKGERLVRMEAMKMEHALKAHFDGFVKKIRVVSGQMVSGGDLIMELETANEKKDAS